MLKILYLILFSFLFYGDHFQTTSKESDVQRILFVVSNADFYGDSDIPSSNHFAELVIPYDILINHGFEIDFTSPEGGAVPLGYFNTSEPLIKKYLYDCEFMNKLKTTIEPNEIDPSIYKAIYYGGGGSAMFGVAENLAIQDISRTIYEENNGIVSALCHGSFGLSELTLTDGNYLVKGKTINGFPDVFENKEGRYFKQFSASVEQALISKGANFQFSSEGWDGYFEVDGRIVTGQDPSSAAKVAETIISLLENKF